MVAQQSIPIDIHQNFERGWNRLQVAIEWSILAVVVLSILGCLGTGLFTRATAANDNLIVTYDRVVRRTDPTEMTLTLKQPAPGAMVELLLPYAFLSHSDIESTSPRSATMRATRDGIVYSFDLGPDEQGKIELIVKPKSFGLVRSEMVCLGQTISMAQLILP